MTTRLAVAAVPSVSSRDDPGDGDVDDDGDLARIRALLVAGWRPGEWDPEQWVLAPAADNVFLWSRNRCKVEGCEHGAARAARVCADCAKRFRTSGGADLDEWLRTATRTPRRRRLSTAPCQVVRGERRCPRPAWTDGKEGTDWNLCASHLNAWMKARRQAVPFEKFLAGARPLSDLGSCQARACNLPAVFAVTRLCGSHQHWWRLAGSPKAKAFDRWVRMIRAPRGPVIVLSGLPELVAAEVLYAIQQREREQVKTEIADINRFVAWLQRQSIASLAATCADDFDTDGHKGSTRFARFAIDRVTLAHATIDTERVKDRWDLRVFGKPKRGHIDFTVIPLSWLRDTAKRWVEASTPRIGEESLAEGVKLLGLFAVSLLTRPDRGEHPEALSRHDIDRFLGSVPRLVSARTGRPYARKEQERIVSRTGSILREARDFGFLDALPGTCAIRRGEFKGAPDPPELAGRALPAVVIAQLDEHLEDLRRVAGRSLADGTNSRGLGPLGHRVGDLAVLAYRLLKGTGRRAGEIASLHVDCVRVDGDDGHVLVYDNHKAGRLGRLLPLADSSLVEAVVAHQRLIRDSFPATPDAHLYLFPRVTKNVDGRFHIPGQSFSKWMRTWVDGLDELHNGISDGHGGYQPFDRRAVYPHAFRHTYAQLLADNGVSPHTLRELMDHRSMETTLGYYQIGEQRKRDAMQVMARHTADRHGHLAHRAGSLSATGLARQELSWVAVPFGKCSEPTNIQAGGNACPIRWQCAACPHFASDPSYLPELRAYVDTLRRQREAALAVSADDWAIDNMTREIDAVQHHIDLQQQHLSAVADDEREAIDSAARDLRKVRQLLPVTGQHAPVDHVR